MKIVYVYDPQTKEYLGEAVAQVNPMNAEEFLMPADAVEDRPPEAEDNQVAVYEGQWKLKPDFRGQTIWQDYETSQEVTEIGEIPEGWSLQRPEKPLNMCKEEALQMLKSLKYTVNNHGVTGDITLSGGSSHKADISLESISNIQGLIMAYQAGILTDPTNYTFADNSTVPITVEDCRNIGASMMAVKDTVHHQVLDAKHAVMEATDAQTINTLITQTQTVLSAYIKAIL